MEIQRCKQLSIEIAQMFSRLRLSSSSLLKKSFPNIRSLHYESTALSEGLFCLLFSSMV